MLRKPSGYATAMCVWLVYVCVRACVRACVRVCVICGSYMCVQCRIGLMGVV